MDMTMRGGLLYFWDPYSESESDMLYNVLESIFIILYVCKPHCKAIQFTGKNNWAIIQDLLIYTVYKLNKSYPNN